MQLTDGRVTRQSVHYSCDACGKAVDLLPELHADTDSDGATAEKKPSKYAAQIAQLHMHSLEPAAAPAPAPAAASPAPTEAPDASAEAEGSAAADTGESATSTDGAQVAASAPSSADAVPAEPPARRDANEVAPPAVETVAAAATSAPTTREPSNVDTFLHYLTIACLVALFALVYKKLLKMQGVLQ